MKVILTVFLVAGVLLVVWAGLWWMAIRSGARESKRGEGPEANDRRQK